MKKENGTCLLLFFTGNIPVSITRWVCLRNHHPYRRIFRFKTRAYALLKCSKSRKASIHPRLWLRLSCCKQFSAITEDTPSAYKLPIAKTAFFPFMFFLAMG